MVVSIAATNDRALQAVVFVDLDRETDLVSGVLKGRSQSLTHRISRRLIVGGNQPRQNLIRVLAMVIDGADPDRGDRPRDEESAEFLGSVAAP